MEITYRFIDVTEGRISLATFKAAMAERKWRDAAIAKADVELLKVQDNQGIGLVGDWREYRRQLRDWPEHEDFPNPEHRPIVMITQE